MWRPTDETESPKFFLQKFANTVSVIVWSCIGPNGGAKFTVANVH